MNESDQPEIKKTVKDLEDSLRTAELTLEAIRQGEVDAVIVKGPKGEQLYSIISPDHPYQVFFENMDEAAVILSKDYTILYANRRFFEMVGLSSDRLIGSGFLNVIKPNDQAYFKDCLSKVKKKKSELSIISHESGIRTVLASIFQGVWEASEQLCLLLTDITDLKRAQRIIQASESIARILSDSTTISHAAQAMIQLLKSHLDWDVLAFWVWDPEQQVLRCAEIAHIPDINIEAFAHKTKELETAVKITSSHAWSSLRPVFIEDVTEDPDFIRRNEAIQNDLHGALTFPFFQKSKMGGLIELYRRTPFREPMTDLMLNLITSIGIEVGFYLLRLTEDRSRLQLSQAVEISLSSIISADLQGKITSWNRGAEKIYGYKSHEMIANNIQKLYPPGKSQEISQTLKAFSEGKSSEGVLSERVNKEGEPLWVNSSFRPIQDLFGMIVGAIIVEQDVTQQKKIAKELDESQARFNSFIEISEDWIWELDREGTFLFSNGMVSKILGYEVDEIVGKSLLYLLPIENRIVTEKSFKENIFKKERWNHYTGSFLHKNGTVRWVESNTSLLFGPDHELTGFRGASRDVTESKNLEKIKNEFISILSHELRTPITSIYGALSLLMEKELTQEERKELLSVAQRNSERLTKLINDTTDIEKIELGKLQFNFQKISLLQVIIEAISSSELVANKFNVRILKGEPLDEVEVYGDYTRLIQVMMNLLSNAIKFTKNQGAVTVSMEKRGQVVRISVKDEGQGIPEEFQPKIFQKFAQAESSFNHITGGTGLGLHIAKSIVEAHGGTLQFITKLQEGTVFFFELPLMQGESHG